MPTREGRQLQRVRSLAYINPSSAPSTLFFFFFFEPRRGLHLDSKVPSLLEVSRYLYGVSVRHSPGLVSPFGAEPTVVKSAKSKSLG